MGQARRQQARAAARSAGDERPAPASSRPGEQQPHHWRLEIYAAALLLATLLAYLPTFNAGFVRWDDQYYVEDSNLLQDTDALKRIWNPFAHDTQQYYPLVFSSYWLEYHLWGLDARSYHVVNVGLHAINALLVLSIVLELGVAPPVAAIAAALFALHPAQVASVAWISELKNTLSGLFYLLAALAYLRHRRSGAWSAYGLCLLAFVGALLSKTQTLTLPASLVLADWALQRLGRVRRAGIVAVLARALPMLALGALAGLVTMQFEERPWTHAFTPVERLLVSTNAALFYARTFCAPLWLSPVYPEWHVSVGDWRWWVAPLLCALAAAALVAGRRRIPELVAWSVAHFYITLIPVLGVFSFNFQTYTFVADHFLYLSLVGGGLAAAIGIERAAAWSPTAAPRAMAAAGLLMLTTCAVLTYQECTHWRDNLAFWTRVRDRDPDGFLGHYNLGNHYRFKGQWAEAVPFYRRAAEIRSHVDFAFLRYAEALGHASGAAAVVDMCTQRLRRDPGFYPAYLERGGREEELGRTADAARDYEATLQLAPRDSAQWNDAQRRRAQLAARGAPGG